MFGKEGTEEQIFPLSKCRIILCKERGHKSNRMHPNYSRYSLRATDLCAAVTPERMISANPAQFGMILAADGSPCLSRQLQDAEIAETWPLLPARQRDSAGLQDPGQSHIAQTQLRNISCLWAFLLHIPLGSPVPRKRSAPSLWARVSLVVQIWLFQSDSWGAAHSLQIWDNLGIGCWVRDQLLSCIPVHTGYPDSHHSIPETGHPLSHLQILILLPRPKVRMSSPEGTAAEEGTFFCLLGLCQQPFIYSTWQGP